MIITDLDLLIEHYIASSEFSLNVSARRPSSVKPTSARARVNLLVLLKKAFEPKRLKKIHLMLCNALLTSPNNN